MGVTLSVIIPTYNRIEMLKMSLGALSKQTYPAGEFEILVVDDGSTDLTGTYVAGLAANARPTLRYFRQDKKGPAAARNMGIKNAEGRIVLFMGDDIIAGPDLLEEHMRWHDTYANENMAILGLITWSPGIEVTDFMRWLENGGPQFDYNAIGSANDADPKKFFYSSNISLKREFMLKNGIFDEDFKSAVYEDVELGHRLAGKGLSIKYNKEAVGYHYHSVDIAGYGARQYDAGISAVLYEKKVCGSTQDVEAKAKRLDTFYFKAKMLFCRLMGPFLRLPGLGHLRYKCYSLILEENKLRGLRKGLEMYGHG